MKKIWLLLSFVVFLLGVVGCEKVPVNNGPGENPLEPTTLLNTKWKLVGFFDIEKDELIEPMAKDCDSCYTIIFQWDSTSLFPSSDKVYFTSARGLMVDVSRVICYDIDYQSSTMKRVMWLQNVDMRDILDGDRLFMGLKMSKQFELTNNELKLYYTDAWDEEAQWPSQNGGGPKKPFYLLFKRSDL